MFGRSSSSMGLVGVDFGTRGIKMLQVRDAAGTLQVVGAARVDVPLTPVTTPAKTATAKSNGATTEVSHAAPKQIVAGDASPSSGQSELSEKIRSAFVAGGFTGRKCVVSLAREDISVQSVRLPKMPDAELRQTVGWEAAQRFGFERTAMEVDFIRTGATLASGENRDEIIIVAASHAAIHTRLEPVLAAGLRPVAVDTAFAALVRTFSRRVRREADLNLVRAVVEIGASGSTVLILRGDQIAFCKPLSISGDMFNRAVAEHLQMNPRDAVELRQQRVLANSNATRQREATSSHADECVVDLGSSVLDSSTDRAVYAAVRPIMNELAKEITLCLRYYGVTFRGHPPERIILAGGDAMEPHLDEVISKACKLQVGFDDAPSSLNGLIGQIEHSMNRVPGPAGCWAASMGLSLREISVRRGDSVRRATRHRPVAAGEAA